MDNCEFCELNSKASEFKVYESKYWIVYLADNQNYPGRCIIPLKRHCDSMANLSAEEWEDFHIIVKSLERIVKEELNATNCNWTCLMNGGFAQKPYNPHIHFHFIPRYFEKSCSVDEGFVDENVAEHYTLSENYQLDYTSRKELVKLFKIYLGTDK